MDFSPSEVVVLQMVSLLKCPTEFARRKCSRILTNWFLYDLATRPHSFFQFYYYLLWWVCCTYSQIVDRFGFVICSIQSRMWVKVVRVAAEQKWLTSPMYIPSSVCTENVRAKTWHQKNPSGPQVVLLAWWSPRGMAVFDNSCSLKMNSVRQTENTSCTQGEPRRRPAQSSPRHGEERHHGYRLKKNTFIIITHWLYQCCTVRHSIKPCSNFASPFDANVIRL